MTKPQRVLFRTGAIASLVTNGFHLVGHFSEPQAPPDENGRLLLEPVRTYRMDMMGSERTMWDLMSGFSLAFSLFLLVLGLFGLLAISVTYWK